MVDELEFSARRLKEMVLSKLHEAVGVVAALDTVKIDKGEVIDDALDDALRITEEAGMHLNELMKMRDSVRKGRDGE